MGVRHTFSHEMAHVLGAHHNRVANGGDDDTDVCSHGWRFIDGLGIERRTIMAATTALTFGDARTRSLNYSNPNVLLNGVSTGTADNDNTRTINNYACGIVQFYRPPAGLSVHISGQNLLCGINGGIIGTGTYLANVIQPGQGVPGAPPYTYRWQWSATGVFSINSPVISTAQSLTIQTIYDCPVFYLRVIVTSQTNPEVYATDIFHVSTALCSQCVSEPLITENSDIPFSHSEVDIYPNPASRFIEIKSSGISYSLPTKAAIYDSQGRLRLTIDLSIVDNNGIIDVSTLNSGLYCIQISHSGSQFTSGKFLILD